MIRKVRVKDATSIAKIYNHYIESSIVTFETELLTTEQVEERVSQISHIHPYYVYEMDNEVVGYYYLNTWKSRCAYSKTLELSIYIDHNFLGQGIGSLLIKHLIDIFNKSDYHALIACISLPNEPSIRLHERFGFEKVAHYKEVGRKFERWIDVGNWELMNRQI